MKTFDWLLLALLVSYVLHVYEEYRGDYLALSRQMMGKLSRGITRGWADALNALGFFIGLFLFLDTSLSLWLRLMFATLLIMNASTHILGSIKLKRWVPGCEWKRS